MAMNLRWRLAKRLRELRGTDSQMAFAKKVGLSSATLNRLELGKQNLTLQSIQRFCTKLKCEVWDLLPPEDEVRLSEFKARLRKTAEIVADAQGEVETLKVKFPDDRQFHQVLDAALKDFKLEIRAKAKERQERR